VGLPGLEPGTSSLSEKHKALQEISRACKIPANSNILCARLFPCFQIIHLGCCTVAAHIQRSSYIEPVPAMLEETASSLINIAFRSMFLTVAVLQ
jgi:hypothetical protein